MTSEPAGEGEAVAKTELMGDAARWTDAALRQQNRIHDPQCSPRSYRKGAVQTRSQLSLRVGRLALGLVAQPNTRHASNVLWRRSRARQLGGTASQAGCRGGGGL